MALKALCSTFKLNWQARVALFSLARILFRWSVCLSVLLFSLARILFRWRGTTGIIDVG